MTKASNISYQEERTQTVAGKPWKREDKVWWCFQILISESQNELHAWLYQNLAKKRNMTFIIKLSNKICLPYDNLQDNKKHVFQCFASKTSDKKCKINQYSEEHISIRVVTLPRCSHPDTTRGTNIFLLILTLDETRATEVRLGKFFGNFSF